MEPERILADGPRGAAELYVALTRATQRLGVLHHGLLPQALTGLAETGTPATPGSNGWHSDSRTAGPEPEREAGLVGEYDGLGAFPVSDVGAQEVVDRGVACLATLAWLAASRTGAHTRPRGGL
ncbi:MAG: hypothetical protein M3332_01210 [Actinomycetota bacterium]|nr:hypothetical protein [Actinomycetota bacterium]